MNSLHSLHTPSRKGPIYLLALAVLAFGLFGHMRASEARIDPFFVLRAQSFAEFRPRILFMIDTSGSMTWKPSLPDQGCVWNECEQPGAGHSRIYAARKAVREVIQQTGDQATFALMSFGHVKWPTQTSQIPTKCYHPSFNQDNRFTWVTTNSAPNSGYVWNGWQWVYQWVWSPITNVFGTQGTWMLCGDNRPFPYLRHDNLGFNMPQKSNEVLLEQPLYKTKSNQAAFLNGNNYNRKVQWFSRYLGRRVNLNCADPLQSAIVQASRGDWGTTVATKNTNICGKDFYYWPYVDGFPGYSYLWARGTYTSTETECYDDATCYTGSDNWYQPGVARRDTYAASLWSPFYSEAVLGDGTFTADQKGPLTLADAQLTMDGLVSDMYAGGIDASGGTPWRSAVGNVDFYATVGANQQIQPTVNFQKTNASFQHYSVASYLTFIQSVSDTDLCKPTAVVYITDGQPDPWDSEGGSELFSRLSKIRRKLGVKSYIAGFSQGFENNQVAWDRLQGMACAAAGSTNLNNPCSYVNTDYKWDTCANPNNPSGGCAWMANDSATLAKALVQIIAGIIQTDVPGGPGMATSEFIPNQNPNQTSDPVQTFLATYTDTAGFQGHVTRQACDTEDPDNPGQLAEWCANASILPLETEEEESFGPCPISRIWDAGECLAQTAWNERRIYSHDSNKDVFRIADDNGNATVQFKNLVKSLNSQGKLSPALSANVNTQNAEIQAMVEFLLGKNMPESWKLAGVPYSSPILVRRIPKANEAYQPSVGVKDPHCAGRRAGAGANEVPSSLKTFANNAWDMTQGSGLGSHYEYTEAVLAGSDMGLIHAFHYDSGNELFAFLPMALISHARQLSVNGVSNFGQSNDIDEHTYGVAATANVAWVYDHEKQTWRHLAVMGLGAGGRELLAFDVSHMGRLAEDDPIDLLWVTSLTEIADDYDDSLGQTWSRPSIGYMVPGDSIANEPYSYLVFGSGYRENQGAVHRGRTVWLVDAITGGEFYNDTAFFQAPPDQRYYDTPDDFTTINDAAISTHCLSGFWAEMQEAYIADPAGRLFRWDIAPDTNNPWVFPQVASSGGKWAAGGNGLAIGEELFRFPACQGKDEFSCTVAAVKQNGNQGDLFVFSPAVAAKNKLDPPNYDGGVLPVGDRDQFLIALISGSPNDNKTDGGDPNNDFHSSLYLLADDHRSPNQEGGITVPGIGGNTAPGAHATFMRMALTDITRTRTIHYPDGTTEQQTREFSKAARPLRSPLVKVTGAANGSDVIEEVEVFYITYTVYEPGEQTCDPRWYNTTTKQWVYDQGTTFEITFRLIVEDGKPFSFLNNYALPGDFGDGFGKNGKLLGPVVEQIGDGGMTQRAPATSPCDPNTGAAGVPTGPTAVSVGWTELTGFSPLEI